MKSINLPHSEVTLPPVILGTWVLGGKNWGHVDQRHSIKTIERALDSGLYAFDTAPAYGLGKAEELLGSIVGNNPDAIIMTKAGLEINNYFKHNLAPQSLENELTASLKRLRRDYVDIFICHWPDPNNPIEETLDKMDEFKKRGLIKSYGLSNYHDSDLHKAQSYGKISLVQMRSSILFNDFQSDILYCNEKQIPLCAYGTLEGGLLTGKYGAAIPSFSKKDVRNFFYKYQDHSADEIEKALLTLKKFSKEKKLSSSTAAAAWSLDQKEINSVIIGARNEKQIDHLIKNFNIT